MIKVKLTKSEWEYDPQAPLGKAGGFGQVFRGVEPDQKQVAIKKLHLRANELAHRELRIVDDLSDRRLDFVIPLLDSGLDSGSDIYYVVMELAEKSLQDELESGNTIDEDRVVSILKDIALGLREVSDIVHRDLKPHNILLHSGKWKWLLAKSCG